VDPFIFHYYLIRVICVICGSFPHQRQYNPQDQPEWYRYYQGQGQPAKHAQLSKKGMPLQCPIDNNLHLIHLERLGNEVASPFLGDSDTESAWELFANEEGSEAKEQKAGLPEEGMQEQIAGLITGKDAQ